MAATLFEGLPDLCAYVGRLVLRRPLPGPVGVVVYHHLGDLVNAAEHALVHYLPLDLDAPELQRSSLGTPYQKWAHITNQDFRRVDRCLTALLVAAYRHYSASNDFEIRTEAISLKDAWHWFRSVHKDYACCRIEPAERRLSLSAVHLSGWAPPDGGRFLNVWNVWNRLGPPADPPPIMSGHTVDIGDRAVLAELCRAGQTNVEGMRGARRETAERMAAAFSLQDLLVEHEGWTPDDSLCD